MYSHGDSVVAVGRFNFEIQVDQPARAALEAHKLGEDPQGPLR